MKIGSIRILKQEQNDALQANALTEAAVKKQRYVSYLFTAWNLLPPSVISIDHQHHQLHFKASRSY